MPDVVAPGYSITAATSNYWFPVFDCGKACYDIKSGTSMATPMVSGIAALVIEANPDLTADEVRQVLFDTAEHRGPKNGNDAQKSRHWGYGLVDAYGAVALAREMANPADISLGVSQTLFPSGYLYGEGSVAKSQSVYIPFTVNNTSEPLAITVTAPEDAFVHCETVDYGWFQITFCEVRPDLDIFLRNSSGTIIARSECPGIASEFCDPDLQYGLQETIAIDPANLVAGDYQLQISFLDVPGTPGSMQNVNYTYQISQGPLVPASGIGVPHPLPSAVAGSDYTSTSTLVTLDGSGSSDDGTIKLYAWQWSITGGLNDGETGNSSEPTPTLDVTVGDGGTINAKLTVIDDLGASDSAEIAVTVDTSGAAPNQDPVADAGPDQAKRTNKRTLMANVNLDGSGSSDPNGDPMTYAWTGTGIPAETTGVAPQLSLPAAVYQITLTVTDSYGAMSMDDVCVEVSDGKSTGACAGGGGEPPAGSTGTAKGTAKNVNKNVEGVFVTATPSGGNGRI